MEFFPHKTTLKAMQLPRIVIIGPDAVEQVVPTCNKLKLEKSTVLICDETTKGIAGDRIYQRLDDNDFDVQLKTISDVDKDTLEEVVSLINETSAHSIMGIGGGRPIDTAKYCSSHSDIPFFSIPTATSHDGIASGRASVTFEGIKASIQADPPIAIIADTDIISQAPYRLMASGCGDIIANYSAVADWKLAHRLKGEEYSNYAAVLSEQTAEMLLANIDRIAPNEEESARVLLKAVVTSGIAMSIAGSSRPASGSEHMFSHALDKVAGTPGLHGEQCGVGSIMMMYLHGLEWEKVKEALSAIKAPVTARDLGVSKEELVEALTIAHEIRPERYTILAEGLSHETATDVAETTGVI
jgi:glycerol-1-phosphate dehydrogenase [NAD(P)+]